MYNKIEKIMSITTRLQFAESRHDIERIVSETRNDFNLSQEDYYDELQKEMTRLEVSKTNRDKMIHGLTIAGMLWDQYEYALEIKHPEAFEELIPKVKPIGLQDWTNQTNLLETLSREFDHQINERNPETEILVASYVREDWSGQAIVIYREGGELFIVEGSHCSCYGLEDQWNPDRIDLAYIDYRTRNGNWFWSYPGYNAEFIQALKTQGLFKEEN